MLGGSGPRPDGPGGGPSAPRPMPPCELARVSYASMCRMHDVSSWPRRSGHASWSRLAGQKVEPQHTPRNAPLVGPLAAVREGATSGWARAPPSGFSVVRETAASDNAASPRAHSAFGTTVHPAPVPSQGASSETRDMASQLHHLRQEATQQSVVTPPKVRARRCRHNDAICSAARRFFQFARARACCNR